MKLPHSIELTESPEECREIYMEAYVADYLGKYKKRNADNGSRVILFGKKEEKDGKTVFIINGAGEEDVIREEPVFERLQEVGCLDNELFMKSENRYEGILTGDRNGGQPINGYHIYYGENDEMKEYLSCFYERTVRDRKAQDMKSSTHTKSSKDGTAQPELTALSERGNVGEPAFYSCIRAAVVCIFIILCAIAVTTVNSYEKMKEFSETAAQMGDTLEEYDSGQDGTK